MADAAGQSRGISTGNEENADGTVGNDRRNRLQLHREKQRSLVYGVKGPRKDKIDDVPEDGMVAMHGGHKKEGTKKKKNKTSMVGYVCVEYALPKSGKSKGSKTKSSKTGYEPNGERRRVLLTYDKGESGHSTPMNEDNDQEPDQSDTNSEMSLNLRGEKEPRTKKKKNLPKKIVDDVPADDMVVMAGWNEHNFDEVDDEAVCVKWKKHAEIVTKMPNVEPTLLPTLLPTMIPTLVPTLLPTLIPTLSPSALPTLDPTLSPTMSPTNSDDSHTKDPTLLPTWSPSSIPTLLPTESPTFSPTQSPTVSPTFSPTESPRQ